MPLVVLSCSHVELPVSVCVVAKITTLLCYEGLFDGIEITSASHQLITLFVIAKMIYKTLVFLLFTLAY